MIINTLFLNLMAITQSRGNDIFTLPRLKCVAETIVAHISSVKSPA